jgi:hypothetical protein
MGVVSVPTRPLEYVISRIVYRASIIQTVKQTVQFFRGTQRHNGRAAIDTCCGLVNVHRTHHQPSVTSDETYQKIEDGMKSISETRCMKSGLNECVRSANADQPVA